MPSKVYECDYGYVVASSNHSSIRIDLVGIKDGSGRDPGHTRLSEMRLIQEQKLKNAGVDLDEFEERTVLTGKTEATRYRLQAFFGKLKTEDRVYLNMIVRERGMLGILVAQLNNTWGETVGVGIFVPR